MNFDEILNRDDLFPEQKVYMMAEFLHKTRSIDDSFWFAIVEMKEKFERDREAME